jgi:hypothetical protein
VFGAGGSVGDIAFDEACSSASTILVAEEQVLAILKTRALTTAA